MAIDYIIGRKLGMSRIFDNQGLDYPVTIVEAGPCSVTQIKSVEKEGYSATQIGFLDKSEHHLNMSEKGHCKKAGISGKKILKEFRTHNVNNIELGQEVTADIFKVGDTVSVTGVSKGRGFAGHMKRHNFSGGRASHGKNSVMRKAGSVGAGTSPGRIWKGSRMAGRMGNETVSVKNLMVTRIEKDKNLVFIKGAIPGAKNGIVYISKQ
jgi:large subunit ribosomal protein L3